MTSHLHVLSSLKLHWIFIVIPWNINNSMKICPIKTIICKWNGSRLPQDRVILQPASIEYGLSYQVVSVVYVTPLQLFSINYWRMHTLITPLKEKKNEIDPISLIQIRFYLTSRGSLLGTRNVHLGKWISIKKGALTWFLCLNASYN